MSWYRHISLLCGLFWTKPRSHCITVLPMTLIFPNLNRPIIVESLPDASNWQFVESFIVINVINGCGNTMQHARLYYHRSRHTIQHVNYDCKCSQSMILCIVAQHTTTTTINRCTSDCFTLFASNPILKFWHPSSIKIVWMDPSVWFHTLK